MKGPVASTYSVHSWALFILLSTYPTSIQSAVPNTVSIQGTLEAPGGSPLTGTYPCRVRFLDQDGGGQELASVTQTIQISETGRFSIQVTPPQALLDAVDPGYELAVDVDGDGFDPEDVFPNLVTIQSVPFALRAGDAENLGGLTAQEYLPSASLSTHVWSLDGNATSGAEFLGTSNNQPLELRANNQTAFIIVPNATTPSIVGGNQLNGVVGGVEGGVISGGGAGDYPLGNQVLGDYGAIVGGAANAAAGLAFVGGGESNSATGEYATVGGGRQNVAGRYSVIAGGNINKATAQLATIGGGQGNHAEGFLSAVLGGSGNRATGTASMIPGGTFNEASGNHSFAAGRRANALHQGSFVWADSTDEDVFSATDDQFLVRASGGISLTVNEGQDGLRIINSMNEAPNLIGGSGENAVNNGAIGSTISGGDLNNIGNGVYSTIGGGRLNRVDGWYSTVPGGISNWAEGRLSFAAGDHAKAEHDGAFVWADSTTHFGFSSIVENEFAIRAANGLRLSKDAPPEKEVGFGEYYRDNSILAWAKVSASGIVNASHGLESVTHVANSGIYTLTVTDSAQNANALVPTTNAEIDTAPAAAADLRIVSINQRNAPPFNTFEVYINRGTGALVDNDFVFMVTGR